MRMRVIAILLVGRWGMSDARDRKSAMSAGGINGIARAIPSGTMMRSIGLSAKAATLAATILANIGVRRSRAASHKAMTSSFSPRARRFSRSSAIGRF